MTSTTPPSRAGASSSGIWRRRSVITAASREPTLWERRASTLSREALGARLFGPGGLALAPPRPATDSVAEIALGGARRRFEVSHARLPTHLWGKLPELGGAILLVEMEPGREGPVHTGLWLSTWGLDPGTLEALRTGLQSMADAVFGPPTG